MARKTAAALKSKMGAAAQVAARINHQMKRDVIHTAADPRYRIKRVPTGSLVVDRLTGGGFARGRHVEIFGDWMVGKSLVAYMTLILAQQRGEVCAVVDPENIFDASWFERLGGNINDLLMPDLSNANTTGKILRAMEQAEDGHRAVDIILVDSVASMLTKEEEDYDLESEADVRTASLARFMSLLLRQVTMGNQDTLFIWTNQWRDKIGRFPGLQFTPGGRALGFYASTRIELMEGEKETESRKVVAKGKEVERKVALGRWVNITLRKEKTGGRPEDFGAFLLNYDTRRIDTAREIIDLGMRDGLIERRGDYFELPTPNDSIVRCHGIKRAVTKIESDDELREFLTLCIQEQTVAIAEGVNG